MSKYITKYATSVYVDEATANARGVVAEQCNLLLAHADGYEKALEDDKSKPITVQLMNVNPEGYLTIQRTINFIKSIVARVVKFEGLQLEPEADTYACADCGKEFTDSNERDDHFMSPACPKHGK